MQPVALRTLGCDVSREHLLVQLLKAVDDAWSLFERSGLLPFVAYLNQYDALLGCSVTVDGVEGRAAGINPDGALLLKTPSGERAIYAGTVERRPLPLG